MERKKNIKKSGGESSVASPNIEHKSFNIKIIIILILHFVGLIGFSINITKPIFQLITPFHLIIISFLLFFTKQILNWNFLIFFLFTYVVSMLSEAIGVNSGLLFGEYYYTDVLGFKITGVPLIIGLIWVTTTFASNHLSNKFVENPVIAAFVAAIFMVLFDILIEQFALYAGLWVWKMNFIPNYNYLTWFCVGFICSIFYQYIAVKYEERLAFPFLGIQMLFFILCYLVNNEINWGFW